MAIKGDRLNSPEVGSRVSNAADSFSLEKKRHFRKLLSPVFVFILPALLVALILHFFARPIGDMVFEERERIEQGTGEDYSSRIRSFAILLGAGAFVLTGWRLVVVRRKSLRAIDEAMRNRVQSLLKYVFPHARLEVEGGIDPASLEEACLWDGAYEEFAADHLVELDVGNAVMRLCNLRLRQKAEPGDDQVSRVKEKLAGAGWVDVFRGVVAVLPMPGGKMDEWVVLESNPEFSERKSGTLKKLIRTHLMRKENTEESSLVHGESLGLFSVASVDKDALGRMVSLSLLDQLHGLFQQLHEIRQLRPEGGGVDALLKEPSSDRLRVVLNGKEVFLAIEGCSMFDCSIDRDTKVNRNNLKATLRFLDVVQSFSQSIVKF